MSHNNTKVLDALRRLKHLHTENKFVNVRGQKIVEIENYTEVFTADDAGIITLPGFSTNADYVEAELNWYDSASNKSDFISNFASMWSQIDDHRGFVNSNYGHLVFSPQNCYQYDNARHALQQDLYSRRAFMVYCPNHIHYTGGNDYVCTMYVAFMYRNGALNAYVSMRSSDLRYGLVGADLAWHVSVLSKLANDLCLPVGLVHWHAVSLHLYERHFNIFSSDLLN